MVSTKQTPTAPPAYTEPGSSAQAGPSTQAGPSNQAGSSSSSSSPSASPPAYILPSSRNYGHSDSDIALPTYDGPLFANYTPDRNTPPTASRANSAGAQPRDTAAVANIVDVEAGRPSNNAPARNIVQRPWPQARRPSANLNRQGKTRRCICHVLLFLVVAGCTAIVYTLIFARYPERKEPEQ